MNKNWAIVIGINQYKHLKHLKYAKSDAEKFKEWLEEKAGFDRVWLFTDDSSKNLTFAYLYNFFHEKFEGASLTLVDNL